MSRLTNNARWRAACLLVLAYVFAVLAPAAANAFASPPSKLVHHAGKRVIAPYHAAQNSAHAHVEGAEHLHHQDEARQNPEQPSNSPGGDRQCCGLACISALPAHDIDVARPDRVVSATISFAYQESAGRSPPRLYRPPIS